jgi:streptomycin 6-kinase
VTGLNSHPVPDDLVLKGAAIKGEAGPAWRARLPGLVSELIDAWSLRVEGPFGGLSYNYVAPATLTDGTAAVLKVFFPDDAAFAAEVEALRIYDGDGVVRLLALDESRRAMLLERALPGTDLWPLPSSQQIEIAAAMMRRLWRTPPPGCTLPPASEEVDRMVALAPQRARGDFPLHRVTRAKAIFDEIEASSETVVLHDDLHQANVLTAQREPWLVIDPHGLVGPPAWDTIQFILNVIWPEPSSEERRRQIARHIDAFSDALSLDRQVIRASGIVRGVMEAFWTLEDHGQGWEKDLAIVEEFAAGL